MNKKTATNKIQSCSKKFQLLIVTISFFTFILLSLPSLANATDLELIWYPNLESDIGGYKIYYGTSPGGYNNIIDVGNTTSYTMRGLNNGTYYIALTAYDEAGNESGFTSEAKVDIQSSSEGSDGSEVGYAGDSAAVGCFIATAAYGSYLDSHVNVLRDFRDEYLLTNTIGKAFVSFYYRTSPPIAHYIGQHEITRTATRFVLTPIVLGVKYPEIAFLIFGLLILLGAYKKVRRKSAAKKAQSFSI